MKTITCLLLTLSAFFHALPVLADAPLVYEGASGLGKGKHLVFIASDHEYRSEETLPALARILAKHHGFKCSVVFGVDGNGVIKPGSNNVPGIEELAKADLMVIFTRFQNWPDDQMKHFVNYLDRAGPIVGLRTATGSIKSPRTVRTRSTTMASVERNTKMALAGRYWARNGPVTMEETINPALDWTLSPNRQGIRFFAE